MTTAQASPFLTQQISNRVTTKAGVASPVTRNVRPGRSFREGWQKVMDSLIDWGWDVSQFEDDDIEPPSRETVRLAIDVASAYRDADELAPPDTIVPDPNGGIVFEQRGPNWSAAIHIWDDGSVEFRRFEGAKLAERRRLI